MKTPLVQRHSLLMWHCHLLAAAVEIDKGGSEVEGKMKTPLVQRHSLLMCHCHLHSAVVEIDKVWQ